MNAIVSSLGDFIRAGLRPRTPLARAIVALLAFKLVIIVVLKVFVFSGDAQPRIDDKAVARLIGPVAQQSQ